jgi:hypothetical protein
MSVTSERTSNCVILPYVARMLPLLDHKKVASPHRPCWRSFYFLHIYPYVYIDSLIEARHFWNLFLSGPPILDLFPF